MRNLLKKWWLLFIAICVFILMITLILITKPNEKQGAGTAGISKEEFEKIKIGMTQFEVNSIIDKLDEWDNDEIYEKCVEKIEESKEEKKYTYTYKYYGEKGGYAIITLQADYSNGYLYNDVLVIKKEAFNLK